MTLARAMAGGIMACLIAPSAAAQTSEPFWLGKTVVALAPSAVGGGYDTYTRLVARYIGKYIPGNPTVVVQNVPGAGGMVEANQLYNVAPKDGTVFGLLDRGMPTAPLIYGQESRAKFDPLRFTWLGNMAREGGVGIVSTLSPAQSIEAMKATAVFFGATGPETDPATYVRLFDELLHTRIKVIANFPSQPEQFLAIERGELDGTFISGYSGTAKAYVEQQIAKGKLKIVVQTTLAKDPALGDVPGLLDLVTDVEDRQMVGLLLSRLALGRPFVAPPGVPEDRAAALRHAFEQCLHDPDLLADAAKLNLIVDPMTADESLAILRQLYRYPATVVERTRKLVHAQ